MRTNLDALGAIGRAVMAAICILLPLAIDGGGAGAQEPPAGFIDRVVASLSVEERVGQLVMVNFVGNDVSASSDIAALVRDQNVGAILVTASNGNIVNSGDTAGQLAALTNGLQQRAYEGSARSDGSSEYFLPLLIATDNEGDFFPFTNVTHNYSQLPNNMTIGATWDTSHADAAGRAVGAELSAAGINMLLGPVVDVLDAPRSGGAGDIGIRSFGGNAAWVGALGRAYVRGVHEGSAGRMLTVAKHFPGHGGSDRATDNEVPTVNKTLEQLRALELASFAEVQRGDAADPLGVTDAVMVSHIRYRNFVPGATMPFTRPISIDPAAFRTLMDLPEFSGWRPDHLVMADSLGVLAVKNWYAREEGFEVFPNRAVVKDALLAGNDLLPLIEFYRDEATRGWKDGQMPLIVDSIEYMREEYRSNPDFRRRADEAVRRVIGAKLKLYPSLALDTVRVDPAAATAAAGQNADALRTLNDAAVTLIEPGSTSELRARVPRGPVSPERVLIVECWLDCYPYRVMPAGDLRDHLLRLYGPAGAGRLQPGDVSTISFGDLDRWLAAPDAPETAPVATAVADADWIIFALTEFTQTRPLSGAAKNFLDGAPVDVRNKNLVAIAYNSPYHLDSTQISKLTAYFAVYNKTDYAIESGYRALFGDLEPSGDSPVDVSGVFYNVDEATRTDPSQTVTISVFGHDADDVPASKTIGLVAGPVVDRNGNPVPHGTTVAFTLTKTGAAAKSAAGRTTDGIAGAQIALDGGGAYTATASVGGITSAPLAIEVDDDAAPAEPLPGPSDDPGSDGRSGVLVLALVIGVPSGVAAAGLAAAGVMLYRRRGRVAVPAAAASPETPVPGVPTVPAALRVDPETRRVYVKGAEAKPPLSNEQFRLLSLLYERAGKVVSREELIVHVWPDAHTAGVSEEALDALVRRVRERIAQAGGERGYIVTLRGQGFRLEI